MLPAYNSSPEEAYSVNAWKMMEDKARWLTGDVPCDERSESNPFSCPFSERGDRAAGIIVCFCGERPVLFAKKRGRPAVLGVDGRYGYVIGKAAAVAERVSSMRRRVGPLLMASVPYPLDGGRAVVVFDVQLYGG